MTTPHKTSTDDRRRMVAEAAYFRAEHRGFDGGDAWADWFEAEAEVDARLDETENVRLVDRLEERLAAVDRKIKAARKGLSGMKSEVREEWERELSKLVKRRDAFHEKFEEIREKGLHAGEKARQQAEKISDDISEVLHRVERKLKKIGK